MSPNSIPFYISKSSINSHVYWFTLYLPDVFLLYQDVLFLFRHPVPTPLPDVSSCIQMFSFLFGHPVPTPTWCFPPVSRCFLFYLDTLYLPLPDVSSCIKVFSFLFGHPVPTPLPDVFLLYQDVPWSCSAIPL